jgi:hypothetical protein
MLQTVLVINLLLMSSAWYQKKWAAIMLHFLVWVFLFSLPFLLRPYINNNKPPSQESQSGISVATSLIILYTSAFLP